MVSVGGVTGPLWPLGHTDYKFVNDSLFTRNWVVGRAGGCSKGHGPTSCLQ